MPHVHCPGRCPRRERRRNCGGDRRGLLAACELARYGVVPRIVERRLAPHRQARATAIQPAGLELLARAGVLAPFLERSVRVRRTRFYARGFVPLATSTFSGIGCAHEYQCSLPQWQTEAILTEHLNGFGVFVERGTTVLSIEENADALDVRLRGPDGEIETASSALKAQMQAFKAMEAEVHAAPDQQISLTDPDARAMGTSGKGTAIVGYNVQTAVDAQHHLIVAHDVTNVGNDRDQLSNMAGQAKAVMGVEALDVLADRGYFKGEEVLACAPLGVTPYVPKPLTSGSKAAGRFGKQDFVYIPEEDAYRCPADQRLTWRFTSAEKGMTLHSYWTSKCAECPLKTQCTTGKERRIKRWEHEAVIDAMQDRLDRAPKSMRVRRATVEHPFGTLKAWMGATHFKTRTLEKVRTEMSLHVLAYNLKRVIAIVGAQPLMAAMRA